MSPRYVLRPKADADLDHQAFYFAQHAAPEVGHRFLIAADQTFTLLAEQPGMGWHPRVKYPVIRQLDANNSTFLKALQTTARPKWRLGRIHDPKSQRSAIRNVPRLGMFMLQCKA